MAKILVLVDCQKDFINKTGLLSVPDAEDIKANIVSLAKDESFDTILVTKDTHEAQEYKSSGECMMFPLHCELGTDGHNLFDELDEALKTPSIKSKTHIFQKKVFNVWEHKTSGFENFVKKNLNKDDKLVIVGVAMNYCVKYNVSGFWHRGYKDIHVPANCTKEIPDDSYKTTLELFKTWGINQNGI